MVNKGTKSDPSLKVFVAGKHSSFVDYQEFLINLWRQKIARKIGEVLEA